MKFSDNDIENELGYIELNFEFSSECTSNLKEYLYLHKYIAHYDDVLQLTNKGEALIGMEIDDLDPDINAPLYLYKQYTVSDEEF